MASIIQRGKTDRYQIIDGLRTKKAAQQLFAQLGLSPKKWGIITLASTANGRGWYPYFSLGSYTGAVSKSEAASIAKILNSSAPKISKQMSAAEAVKQIEKLRAKEESATEKEKRTRTTHQTVRDLSEVQKIAIKTVWGSDPVTGEIDSALLDVHHIEEHRRRQDNTPENLIPLRVDIHRQLRAKEHPASLVVEKGKVYFKPTNPRYKKVLIVPPKSYDKAAFVAFVEANQ